MSAHLRILVVCTANACRSPVAERLLDRRLRDRGVAAVVRSAGTRGGRFEIHVDTLLAARELDLPLAGHESRLLTADLITSDGADLVLGMTREHLREIVALEPSAWPRTFTLMELARRSYDLPAAPAREWIAAAAAGRRAADLMAPSDDDDLPDPYGGPARGHVEMVHTVDALTERIADALSRT